MPHLVLEYSANLLEKATLPALFKKCHTLLADMLPTEVRSCISRAVEYDQYHIGEGQPNKAFIHVNLKVKAGRTFEVLQKTSESLLKAIKEHCMESYQQKSLQISLEVIELPYTYFSLSAAKTL
jgi:5-carboxymethyl-2-hydroxymuconate isomerase